MSGPREPPRFEARGPAFVLLMEGWDFGGYPFWVHLFGIGGGGRRCFRTLGSRSIFVGSAECAEPHNLITLGDLLLNGRKDGLRSRFYPPPENNQIRNLGGSGIPPSGPSFGFHVQTCSGMRWSNGELDLRGSCVAQRQPNISGFPKVIVTPARSHLQHRSRISSRISRVRDQLTGDTLGANL